MSRLSKWALLAGAAAVIALGAAAAVPAAHADAPLFTASTSISNDAVTNAPHNIPAAKWATDGPGSTPFKRTLSVYSAPASTCTAALGALPPGDACYTATISDSGPFVTILSAKQPNQSLTATGDTISHVVTGNFSGSASYVFDAPSSNPPSAASVPPSVDLAAGDTVTASWYKQSDPAANGVLNNDWSWTYATGCESWTDSFANKDGQSTPISQDGNITGIVCSTPAPTPSPTVTTPPPSVSVFGDEVNPFGNGFDVYRQRAAVNTAIAGWPATQHDPATHFLREAEGSAWRFEYAPHGGGTGLCVSNPAGGYLGDPAGPTGLVLRGCNASKFQQFAESGGHLVSVINGQVVNPAGTGGQLRTGTSPVSWGGSVYGWRDFSALPA